MTPSSRGVQIGYSGSESPLRSDGVGAGVEPAAALPIMMVPRNRREIAVASGSRGAVQQKPLTREGHPRNRSF